MNILWINLYDLPIVIKLELNYDPSVYMYMYIVFLFSSVFSIGINPTSEHLHVQWSSARLKDYVKDTSRSDRYQLSMPNL